jgi:hypothetical protein
VFAGRIEEEGSTAETMQAKGRAVEEGKKR